MLTLIRKAKIYAPEYLGVQDILIADSRIQKIAPDIPAVSDYEVQVLEGEGMLVFPGFLDSHVHILGGGGEGSYHTRTPEIMLTDITLGGVTTVVGCLGTDGTTRSAASLLAKARGLEEEGISTYIYTGSYQVPVRTLYLDFHIVPLFCQKYAWFVIFCRRPPGDKLSKLMIARPLTAFCRNP